MLQGPALRGIQETQYRRFLFKSSFRPLQVREDWGHQSWDIMGSVRVGEFHHHYLGIPSRICSNSWSATTRVFANQRSIQFTGVSSLTTSFKGFLGREIWGDPIEYQRYYGAGVIIQPGSSSDEDEHQWWKRILRSPKIELEARSFGVMYIIICPEPLALYYLISLRFFSLTRQYRYLAFPSSMSSTAALQSFIGRVWIQPLRSCFAANSSISWIVSGLPIADPPI